MRTDAMLDPPFRRERAETIGPWARVVGPDLRIHDPNGAARCASRTVTLAERAARPNTAGTSPPAAGATVPDDVRQYPADPLM